MLTGPIDVSKQVREILPEVGEVRRGTSFNRAGSSQEEIRMSTHFLALLVMTKQAGAFAVNITGAQFGWCQPSVPWNDFKHLRSGKDWYDEPLGTLFKDQTETMINARCGDSDASRPPPTAYEQLVGGPSLEWDDLYRTIYYTLHYCVEDQLEKMHLTAKSLLKLNEEQYLQSYVDLLESVEQDFDKQMTSLEASNIWYLERRDGVLRLCKAGSPSERLPEHLEHAMEDLQEAGLIS